MSKNLIFLFRQGPPADFFPQFGDSDGAKNGIM